MRVFVDASAWVAFFNRRDVHQVEARQGSFGFDEHFVDASRQRGFRVL